MCIKGESEGPAFRTIPVAEAVNSVLAHDITEIRPGEFKGRAFKKGHIIREEDICHLQRLGKERLFVMDIPSGYVHEDDAAARLALALAGEGVEPEFRPSEGRINLTAKCDGLLRVDTHALMRFNMLGDVMCATLHNNTAVRKGRVVAATRAIPLVVSDDVVETAAAIAREALDGLISVHEMRRPRAGVVITGTEIFNGRVKDSFAGIIAEKIRAYGGEVIRTVYAPDDVTRFAIKRLGADGLVYGSAALPGAMLLVAYIGDVPILGVPACGVHHKTTVFDLVLPRVLAGEKVGREELAELGHGGLCLSCEVCRYPVCPFGK